MPQISPLQDHEVVGESEFLSLNEDQRWMYFHRYLVRIEHNTKDVVSWANNIRGGVIVLGALATLGKWMIALGAAWAAFKVLVRQ